MRPYKCCAPGCRKKATIYVEWITNDKIDGIGHYCNEHYLEALKELKE